MDMSGRVVLLQVANSEKTIIDVPHLNAGNYWLKVNSHGTPVPFVKN
jgi:hypothetical protein